MQPNSVDKSQEITEDDLNMDVRPASDLPEEILQRVAAASATEPTPVNETIRAIIETTAGDIVVELYGAEAPLTVGNFVKLAQMDFYDGLTFHRVIPGFMIQGGDPLTASDELRPAHGSGGPGYTFEDEINDRKIVLGSLAMANGGPNTNGSQFFIVVAEETPHLDGVHTNFGQVIDGMDIVVDISRVERDRRLPFDQSHRNLPD